MNEAVAVRPKVGLEIHRQLDTQHKLFCACPTDFVESEPEKKFLRRLRPTQSELGQLDEAALFEFHRGRSILYEADGRTSCLVEMDEEPPGLLNTEAVETSLSVALLVNADIVDEIHVMRKIVIDGSNTTGFQRTCVVAIDGHLTVHGKKIPIQQISLEEDAARKTGQSQETIGYKIDRLGVPLIEISTAPIIESPEEAKKVALAIGTILRATRKVKRGLGSIRQDLNVSIPNGALIEIKGVQELEILDKVVEFEINRQVSLLEIKRELASRSAKRDELVKQYVDLTDIFRESKARIFRDSLGRGGSVLGVRLQKFAGLLKKELGPNLRFGTELSSRAAFWGGVGGIFHSDELPGYGITQTEVDQVGKRLAVQPTDAFVLVADLRDRAEDALNAVVDRAIEAMVGVPEETRAAMPDGTTRYMRPRPGAARMYPETDVPPTPITADAISKLKQNLPVPPEVRIKQLMDKYSLNDKLARQLVDSDYLELYEEIATTTKVPPTFIATFLTETIKSLQREKIAVEIISDGRILSIFQLIDSGQVAKEAASELLKWLATHLGAQPQEGLNALGLRMLSDEELSAVIDRHIEKNRKLVTERGQGAFSSIMGSVMSEVRGSTDANRVAEIVKRKLATAASS